MSAFNAIIKYLPGQYLKAYPEGKRKRCTCSSVIVYIKVNCVTFFAGENKECPVHHYIAEEQYVRIS